MNKQEIKVGKTKMYAQTVPVNMLFDEIFPSADFPIEVMADRFQIMEVDGYYLVSHEAIVSSHFSKHQFKCFLNLENAKSYLRLLGVEVKNEE